MIQPVLFDFHGEACRIHFIRHPHPNRKSCTWYWLFDCPDGSQNAIPEPEVCRYLDISPRTALDWRLGKPANKAALYCLYLHGTRRQIPASLARRGMLVKGDALHWRQKRISHDQIPDWDWLLWLLKQQTAELKAIAQKTKAPNRAQGRESGTGQGQGLG